MDELFEPNQQIGQSIDTLIDGGEPTATRASAFAVCLRDARAAYTEAKENASSEDIRSVAISFFIDEGKNGRTATIAKQKTAYAPAAQTAGAVPHGVSATEKKPVAFATFACPECGAKLYDNKATKFSEKSPDYKCSKCDKAGWERTNKTTGAKFISWNKK